MNIDQAVLEMFPMVHLYKNDIDGHMVASNVNPKVRYYHEPPSKFQLIPLRDPPEGDFSVIEPTRRIESRAEALEEMRGWKYVAILSCDKGTFISCRRAFYEPVTVGWTALTEYRATIGEFESFRIKYHPESGGFSFATHNELYLDCNRTFWTVASRGVPKYNDKTVATNRSWIIFPLLAPPSNSPRIEFVGAFKNAESYEMQLLAEGSDLGEGYLDGMRENLTGVLEHGQSTYVSGGNEYLHFLLCSGDTTYVLITNSQFSRFLAGECLQDLILIHKKYSNDGIDAELQRYGLLKHEMIRKELEYLLCDYFEQNEENITNTILQPILLQMDRNIEGIIQNIGNAEILLELSHDLETQAKLFKKQARTLRNKISRAWIFAYTALGGTIGASVGALVGFLIGGPAGTAILGTQAAEIGAGLAIGGGGASLITFVGTCAVRMWQNFIDNLDIGVLLRQLHKK